MRDDRIDTTGEGSIMSYAQLEAAYVVKACIGAGIAIENAPRDFSAVAANIVRRLQRLAMAASCGPHAPQVITMTDDEFQLIADYWEFPESPKPDIF
jgi:hypothetical protein